MKQVALEKKQSKLFSPITPNIPPSLAVDCRCGYCRNDPKPSARPAPAKFRGDPTQSEICVELGLNEHDIASRFCIYSHIWQADMNRAVHWNSQIRRLLPIQISFPRVLSDGGLQLRGKMVLPLKGGHHLLVKDVIG